ncbi:MAG TPA: DUF58 domain-containing protein [Thiotrichales bacterium]|nr:DUF58 domain-containing protein [Thiotrichales bacterium]
MSLADRISSRRLAGPEANPVYLHHRRVYILPTRSGWLFALTLLVLLLGAINYGNSLAYSLTFLLASLGVISIFHTHRNLVGLQVDVLNPSPAFAGEGLTFPVVVSAPDGPVRNSLRLIADGGKGCIPAIDPAGDAEVPLQIPAPRRGIQRLGRLRIETDAPLGIVRAWAWLEPASEGIVWPRPLEEAPAPEQILESDHHEGGRARRGDDFEGFRDWQPGDPPSRIAWRRLAVSDRLLVRLDGGGASRQHLFRWQETPPGDPEYRLSMLARQILDAHRQGAEWGLELPGVHLPPDRGETHLHRGLTALARHGGGASA